MIGDSNTTTTHHPSPITHHPSPITHHPSPNSPFNYFLFLFLAFLTGLFLLKADILQGVPVSFSSGGAMALLMLMAVGAMIGRGMFVSAWNVDYIPGKINNDPGFFEEIKPQEAFNGALRGKIVTDDFHIFNFNPKGPEFGDNDDGNIFNTASCGYFDLAPRAQRIASYGDGGLNGDDGVRGPGIHGHLQRKLNPWFAISAWQRIMVCRGSNLNSVMV